MLSKIERDLTVPLQQTHVQCNREYCSGAIIVATMVMNKIKIEHKFGAVMAIWNSAVFVFITAPLCFHPDTPTNGNKQISKAVKNTVLC